MRYWLKKRSRLALFLSYTALQGVFLPILLKMDEVDGVTYAGLFICYEVLLILDACLGIMIFGRHKE